MQVPGRLVSVMGSKNLRQKSAETYTNLNPASGDSICEVEVAGKLAVDLAVASAQEAFQDWSRQTGAERGRILTRAAHILRSRNDELARIEVADCGKPLAEALEVDVASAADCLEYFGGIAAAIKGEHFSLGNNFAYTRKEPLGVIAAIGAWNYPLQIACWKAAPALAAGNTMVFKPSEMTPVTAVLLAAVFKEAGLPDGVFNVVLGGAETGKNLCEHKEVAKISLTGSLPTGKAVYASASKTIKPVTLELGGKSPLIIFADANIDDAVSAAMLGNFYTQGEICTNATRVFVESSIKDEFLEKLTERTKQLTVGDPLDLNTDVGALISIEHCKKVQNYIDLGVKEGAKLICGGGPPSGLCSKLSKAGTFLAPTIFDCPSDDLTIVKEEIFGPVLSLLSFQSEGEVTERANNTEFGLAAGVFTKDLSRAHRVIANLKAGTCWINSYNVTPIELPFGGYKMSGLGRENSERAIDYYTQLKSVYVETGHVQCPYK